MKETMGQRLKRLRKAAHLTQAKLAAQSGVSQGTIGNIEADTREYGVSVVGIARTLKVNPQYLTLETDDATPPEVEVDMDAHPDLVPIRKGKLRLQGGIGGFSVDPEEGDGIPIFFRTEWLRDRGYKPYSLLALKVRGSSMEPSLFSDDMVVINTADTTPKDGEVFAVNYEGEGVIKRLMRDGGSWWLVSDNPDQRRYPRKEWVDGSSFLVGRVIHKQSERI